MKKRPNWNCLLVGIRVTRVEGDQPNAEKRVMVLLTPPPYYFKLFIPRRDSAEQSPKGVQLFLFDGMGWDGMGWGETGYQKCPSMCFILCRYIDKIYTYLYI